MDHVSSMEERIVTERIRRKLEEVNAAAEKHLAGVQDHVNFTMQQAYFKCAYDCFDRRRSQEGINNCVENCSVPVLSANNVVETEMAKFQLNNGPGQSQFGWLTPTSASLGSSCQLSSTRWSTMSTSSSDSNTFNRLFLELYTAWLFFKREEYWWSGLSMMVVLTMWVNMLPIYGFFLRKKPPLGHMLERLNRSLMVCQDKFEAAKLQKMKTDAAEDLESCVNRSIDDSIRVLPHVIEQIKSSLSIN